MSISKIRNIKGGVIPKSLVSYYVGDTLLSTEKITKGAEIPLIKSTLADKYLWGWSLTSGGKSETSIIATGEPMILYADTCANPLKIYSPWTSENRILISKGTTSASASSGNNTVYSGWATLAKIDLTHVTKLTCGGGTSNSFSSDASGGSSLEFKLDSSSSSSWNTSAMTGVHTLYMRIKVWSGGPHEDEWSYNNSANGSCSYITATLGD